MMQKCPKNRSNAIIPSNEREIGKFQWKKTIWKAKTQKRPLKATERPYIHHLEQ